MQTKGVNLSRGPLLGATVALFIACSPTSPPSAPAAIAPAIPNAPLEVDGRPPLPFCGSEVVALNGSGFNVEARVCFWAAHEAGQPAEFISTQPTVEGDPITQIFRLLPSQGVEVFINSTRDQFSSREWLRLECSDLIPIPDAPVDPSFVGAGCTEATL